MLSDEVIDKIAERLVIRMESINEKVLKHIGESMKSIGALNVSQAQQLVQILKYGGDYDKLIKELTKITNLSAKEIKEIFNEVAKIDYDFSKDLFEYRKIKFIPYEENYAFKSQVEALASITEQEFINFSNTTMIGFGIKDEEGNIILKGIKETYYDLIDEAALLVSQGKDTFDSVMRKRIKELGESGLRVIYPTLNANQTNRTMRLDSAVRMNLKGAIRDLHNHNQEELGKLFGSDGVEISVHLAPAPDHAEVQGHQFRKEEFEKFQNDIDSKDVNGKPYPAKFGKYDRRSISQYNCYHTTFAIIVGVSIPNYTEKELQNILDKNEEGFEFENKHYTMYEGTQLQRHIELEVRKLKDYKVIAESSGYEDEVIKTNNKIRVLRNKYKQLSEVSGLSTRMERMR